MLALKYHPDKNNNSPLAHTQFQQLNEANEYLWAFADLGHSDSDADADADAGADAGADAAEPPQHTPALMKSVRQFLLLLCKSDAVLKRISPLRFVQLFRLLQTYPAPPLPPLLHTVFPPDVQTKLHSHYLWTLSKIDLVQLNPSVDDLLDANVFVLRMPDHPQPFFVPLWHYEVVFKPSSGGAAGKILIVKCLCTANPQCEIDADNNLVTTLFVPPDKRRHVANLHDPFFLPLRLTETKQFMVPLHQLRPVPLQLHCLKNCGIPKINLENAFSITERAHIYALVHMT